MTFTYPPFAEKLKSNLYYAMGQFPYLVLFWDEQEGFISLIHSCVVPFNLLGDIQLLYIQQRPASKYLFIY